jgi:hypothetical protein
LLPGLHARRSAHQDSIVRTRCYLHSLNDTSSLTWSRVLRITQCSTTTVQVVWRHLGRYHGTWRHSTKQALLNSCVSGKSNQNISSAEHSASASRTGLARVLARSHCGVHFATRSLISCSVATPLRYPVILELIVLPTPVAECAHADSWWANARSRWKGRPFG